MAKVPILCRSCERLSITESILGGDVPFAVFENVGFGPCPYCGGDCDVLDGSYTFIGDTISFLGGPDRTTSELQRLASALEAARNRGDAVKHVAEEVKRNFPKFSSLIDILPRNRAEFYAFISIVIAIVGLIIDSDQKGSKGSVTVNHVINNIQIEQTVRSPQPQSTKHNDRSKPSKLGRNDRCHCGSGKKFKKCHGS